MSKYTDFWKMIYHGTESFHGFIDSPDNRVAITYNLINELEIPHNEITKAKIDNLPTRLAFIEADSSKKGLATMRDDTLSILFIGTHSSIKQLILEQKKAK